MVLQMCVQLHLVLAGIVVIRDIQSQVRLYHVATPTVVTGGAAHSCAASHTTYDKSTRVDQLSIYNIVKHYFYGAGDILVLTFFSAFRQIIDAFLHFLALFGTFLALFGAFWTFFDAFWRFFGAF